MSSRFAQARRRNPKDREVPKIVAEEYYKNLLDEKDGDKKRKEEELKGWHWFWFVLGCVGLICGTSYLHVCLPQPKEPNQENTQFSEIRAKPILHKLSALGPKPSGSHACEEQAVPMIIDELNSIKSTIERGEHSLEVQTQYPSGCFDIPRFDTDGFGICYKNVSNVIARLGSKKRPWHEEHSAVLINCHYDTWPTSHGGSDDLISCALMLELIRVLGEPKQTPVPHDVIFLFNGAEESSLLAAHGFITQHPWRHSIKAFINLEASGSGGKELLFQAGPANQWLLNSYLEAAVHPHCSVFGQEIFQSGVYPGDTDFRVFRDHGRIPGLDLAFVKNGYWWHTEFDTADLITNGSLQRAGENVLSTLRHLLKSPYLETSAEYGDKKFVFFDFYGLFTVVYSWDSALVLNYGTISATFALITWRLYSFARGNTISGYSLAHLHYGILTHILCAISIFLPLYVIQLFHNHFGIKMAWYSNHWIVIPQYVIPLLFSGTMSYVHFVFNGVKKNDIKFMEKSLHETNILINAFFLLITTYHGYASGFIFMILSLFPLLRDVVYSSFRKLFKMPDSNIMFSIFHILYVLPGIMMVLYTVEMLIWIFIPIMGRSSGNSEMTIGTFCAILCLFTCMAMGNLILRTSKKTLKNILVIGIVLVVLSQAIVIRSGTPYNYEASYPTARRTQVYHVRRSISDYNDKKVVQDSGLIVISQDNRGALDIPYVLGDDKFKSIECNSSSKYCERIPYYFPTASRIKEKHIRFKKGYEVLQFENPAKIILNDKKIEGRKIVYDLTLQGGGQISFSITPHDSFIIHGWKLKSQEKFITNSTFGYFTCSGRNCGQWDLILELEEISTADLPEKPLQITLTSHYLHGADMQSHTIKSLLEDISAKRKDPRNWRWAMTASAWSADLVSKYL